MTITTNNATDAANASAATDIFRFQITEYNTMRMQEFHSFRYIVQG